jgi:hypothetical protein
LARSARIPPRRPFKETARASLQRRQRGYRAGDNLRALDPLDIKRRGDGAIVFEFLSLLVFVYHCFDRIVIHGYLTRSSPSSCAMRSAPTTCPISG